MLVCLDMGHGLDTPGKCTPTYPDGSVVKEAVQNYAIGNVVYRLLQFNEIQCIITNDNINIDMDLSDRVAVENSINADIFVSIHKNASPEYNWNSIRGTETYCYKFGYNGERLARLIHKYVINDTNDNDRGIKEGNFKVLRDTEAPAVLCELGFMTNYEDAKDMTNEKAIYDYAVAITKGICDYFNVLYQDPNNNRNLANTLIDNIESDLKRLRKIVNS